MNSIEVFLNERLPFTGLAAWSVQLGDRTVASGSYVPWMPAPRAQAVLARLALAAQGLRPYQGKPMRLCYRFEHLSCHLGLRQDGACLALIVQNQQHAAPGAELAVLREFVEMPEPKPEEDVPSAESVAG